MLPWGIFYFFSFNQPTDRLFDMPTALSFPSDIHVNDWHKELQYLKIVKDSLVEGELPFYVNNVNNIFNADSDAFLAIPIYPLSIQSISLLILDPMSFHILNHLLFILIGFWGCYLIKNEYSLSFTSFLFILVTFNFYGGFVAKMGAYGPAQLGYYFSPFIILLLLKLSNKDNAVNQKDLYIWSIYLAMALAAILFQGSLSIVLVPWVTFLVLWGIFNIKYIRFLLVAAVATVGLTAVRLFPAAVSFGTQENHRDVYGYGLNPEFFLQTFISIRNILDHPVFSWWEYSNYISLFGFLAIFYFCFINYILEKNVTVNIKPFVFPLIVLFVISFHKIREFVIPDFVPLLNLESLTTRYMFIVCLFLVCIAGINFDAFYKSIRASSMRLLVHLMLGFHIGFLYLNVFQWPLQRTQAQLYLYGPEQELATSLALKRTILSINNSGVEAIYKYTFYFGLGLTALTIIVVLLFLIKKYAYSQNCQDA